jgi:hypothetical protein
MEDKDDETFFYIENEKYSILPLESEQFLLRHLNNTEKYPYCILTVTNDAVRTTYTKISDEAVKYACRLVVYSHSLQNHSSF